MMGGGGARVQNSFTQNLPKYFKLFYRVFDKTLRKIFIFSGKIIKKVMIFLKKLKKSLIAWNFKKIENLRKKFSYNPKRIFKFIFQIFFNFIFSL